MPINSEGYDGKNNLIHVLKKKGKLVSSYTEKEMIEHLQALLRNRDAYIETLEKKFNFVTP